MGRALCDFANGKLHAYIDGGFEFVAARDVVEGHVLAMQKGRKGEKYIFATQFLTLPEIMDMWVEITGQPKPKVKLPVSLMSAFAEVASPLLTRFAPDFPQRLTPGAVRILQLRRRADLTKAKTELGYQPTSIRTAFEEAYDFHARRGAIHAPNPRRIRDVPPAAGARAADALYSDGLKAEGRAEGGPSNGHKHNDMPTGGCPVAH
jgi:nucleoside-diphosphate-sugar epimerase